MKLEKRDPVKKKLLMRNIDCYNLFAWNDSWFWDLYWIFPALPDISRLFIKSSREQNGMVIGPDTVVLSCLGEVRTSETNMWNTLWITSEDEILEQFNWSGWLFNFKSIMGIDSEPHGISTVLPPRCLSLTHRRDVAKIGTKTH